MAIPAPLISGAINLVSGIFGRNSQKKAAMAARTQARQDFFDSGYDTRYAAEKGGFNPLTFLAATGGGPGASGVGFSGGGSSAPGLASQELIVGGLQDFGSVISGEWAQQQKERRLAYDLAKLEYDKSAAASVYSPRGAAGASRSSRPMGESATYVRDGRPRARPTASTEPRVPLFAPNGATILVPQGIAERIGVKPYQNLAMGEYTELMGEIRGEGEGIVDLALDIFGWGGVSDNMSGGDFYNAPGMPDYNPTGKNNLPPAQKDGKSFWSYFGHAF